MMAKMSKEQIERTFNNKELNCIIKKIPIGWNHKDLQAYASQFGELLSVKVSKSFYWGGKSQKDDAGKIIKREDYIGPLVGNPQFDIWKGTNYQIDSNGYGYACFKTEEGQKECLDNYWRQDKFLEIQTPQGLKIQQFDISKREIQQVSNVVFFKNFPQNFTKDQIEAECRKFGEVLSVFIYQDASTGRNNGNASVTFKSGAESEKAIAALNGFKINNQALYAASLIPKAKMQNMVTKTFLKQNLYV